MDKVNISKGYNSLTGECSSELDTPPVSQIIDGVDVSECKYNKGYCRISALCDYSGHICEVDHDCYYKQLQRLKAENERLKFKLNTVEADYEASEIEIEDLKNKLNLLTKANNHLLELDKYRQKELETKAEANKSNIHNLALLSKTKKALQEIRDKLDFHKQELEECLHNPIDDEIREIINSVIGAE